LPILAYHMVEPDFDLAITRVSPQQFSRQIDLALHRGFSFVTLDEYIHRPSPSSIALTFDDGYASIHQYAFPILQKHNIQATVFIIAGYVGQFDAWDVNFGSIRFRHLSWPQLEALHQAGWQIESHSLYHNDLTRIDRAHCLRELVLSKRIIEKRLRIRVRYISFPFGNSNKQVVQLCQQAGYEGGVVMSRGNDPVNQPFGRQRLGIYYFDNQRTFLHKILAKYEKSYKFMQRMLDVCSDGTVLVKHGIRAIKR